MKMSVFLPSVSTSQQLSASSIAARHPHAVTTINAIVTKSLPPSSCRILLSPQADTTDDVHIAPTIRPMPKSGLRGNVLPKWMPL
jgi:hypothetical protein